MSLTLYDASRSGHCHRVRLLLALLKLGYDKVAIDVPSGAHKHPDYVKLSPLGQVPTLVDGDDVITDSTAALVYLAKKYGAESWLPRDPTGAARVQRWLSCASGELYRGPVMARSIKGMGRDGDYAYAAQWAERLFVWMQAELSERTWLAAAHPTIADVAIYSYVKVADEGELDISPYPAIARWLQDVERLDGFEPMPHA